MNTDPLGTLLAGERDTALRAREAFEHQPLDWDLSDGPYPASPESMTTIRKETSISGPGTFFRRATRRISFLPSQQEGWWFDRSDLPDCLPTRVSIRNVWTTGHIVSNIVLRSGPPHNYVRMVEHIIALKIGLGIDNLLIRIDSGDPPLFNHGSRELTDTLADAGRRELGVAPRYLTVREKVTVAAPHGGFLTFEPCPPGPPSLLIDCAVDFPNAIGRQRVRFPVTSDIFRYASEARTNTTAGKKLYCQTIGRIFADVRNLGYTSENLLVAGKHRYVNPPRLIHEGKSLEAVWHRAALDLLAAVALIDRGRFVGKITSYRAGHRLDVKMVTMLYLNDLFVPFSPSPQSVTEKGRPPDSPTHENP